MSAGPGGSYGSESFRTWEWDPPPFRKDESSRREGEKSTTADLLSKHAVLKRDYRFCTRPGALYMMTKKKNRIELAKKIISSVKREMQKPRLAESVRSDKRDQAAPVGDGLRVPRKSDSKSST